MRKAADMGVGLDDEAREFLVVKDAATRAIAAIPTKSCHTDQASMPCEKTHWEEKGEARL